MISIFKKSWPAPPIMSKPQYQRYRLKLLIIVFIWICFSIVLAIYWAGVHVVLKGVFLALGYIFIPDFGIFEQIFTSYEKYLKEAR